MNHPEESKTQQEIRAVIFDLGGVILRTEDPQPRQKLAEKVGKTRWELEDIVFKCEVSSLAEEGRATMDEVWASVQNTLNLRPEEMESFSQEFFGGDRVDFALIELLRSLRPTYRTALLSNGWRLDLPDFLENQLHIPADTFDVVVSSAACGVAKPRPEIFHLTLDLLGVEAQQAVFVDDNQANIESAERLGLHTIHFKNSQQAQQELARLVQLP